MPLDLGDEIGYFNLVLDPETDEVVGFHIEDFLAYAVKRRPVLLHALARAELHGVSAADVARMRSAAARGPRPPVATTAVLDELARLGAHPPYEG